MMHLHKENFVPKRLLSQINIGYRLYFYKNGDLFECRQDFTDSSVSKESTCSAGDPGLIPRLGRSAGEGMGYPLWYSWASLVAQTVKKSTCNARDLGSTPGLGRSLKKGMTTHSSILAWRIPMDRGAWRATVHGVHKEMD